MEPDGEPVAAGCVSLGVGEGEAVGGADLVPLGLASPADLLGEPLSGLAVGLEDWKGFMMGLGGW